jgi:hypothetical protein
MDKEHIMNAGLKKKDKLELELEDADEPHLPNSVLGLYWMAASATNRLLIL